MEDKVLYNGYTAIYSLATPVLPYIYVQNSVQQEMIAPSNTFKYSGLKEPIKYNVLVLSRNLVMPEMFPVWQ